MARVNTQNGTELVSCEFIRRGPERSEVDLISWAIRGDKHKNGAFASSDKKVPQPAPRPCVGF